MPIVALQCDLIDAMTSSQSVRPTTDVSVVILDSLDDMVGQLVDRLEGITTDEYLWEPVTDVWTVRQDPGAAPLGRVDMSDDRDIDPAPLTTIAWRLWHISIDCLDDYTRRFAGDDGEADRRWFLEPGPAIESLQANWTAYRSTVSRGGDFWAELGDGWGPWSRHCIADMVMHASNELVHHGAEVALLRDLYRQRPTI